MSRRILVADDSSTIQKVIKIAFSRFDVEMVEAGSYIEALAAIARGVPDALIADASLPGAQGPNDFAKLQTESRGAPTLLLAGTYEAVDEAAFRRAGFQHFLKKPFESGDLVAIIERLLGGNLGAEQAAARNQQTTVARAAHNTVIHAPGTFPGLSAGDDDQDGGPLPPPGPGRTVPPGAPGARGAASSRPPAAPSSRPAMPPKAPGRNTPAPPGGDGSYHPPPAPRGRDDAPRGRSQYEPSGAPYEETRARDGELGNLDDHDDSDRDPPRDPIIERMLPRDFGSDGYVPPAPQSYDHSDDDDHQSDVPAPPLDEARKGRRAFDHGDEPEETRMKMPPPPLSMQDQHRDDDDEQTNTARPAYPAGGRTPAPLPTIPSSAGLGAGSYDRERERERDRERDPQYGRDEAEMRPVKRPGGSGNQASELDETRVNVRPPGSRAPDHPAAPPLDAAMESLLPWLEERLPVLVRQAVEEYCERHFKVLAREVIASELRRLADEKARHLVDG